MALPPMSRLQQFPDIAQGKHVRVDNHRATLVVHQLRRREAQGSEGLQVVVEPGAHFAVAQVLLSLPLGHAGEVLHLDEFDIELLGMGRVFLQGVATYHRTQLLLVVGVNENSRFQTLASLGGLVW